MAGRGPLAVFTTLTCPVVGAKAPIAAIAAGAPTNGFINSPGVVGQNGFGFRGKLRAATGNSGTVTIEVKLNDSAGASQTYDCVLAAGEETVEVEVDLTLITVYGSAASQKLHVMGNQ